MAKKGTKCMEKVCFENVIVFSLNLTTAEMVFAVCKEIQVQLALYNVGT